MSVDYGQKLSPPDELWVSQTKFPAEARAALHFAAAINTTDTDWLSGLIAPGTTYSSQRLLNDLRGDEIVGLVARIAESMRKTERSVAADLGICADDRPCALVYMSASPSDQSWLRLPNNVATFDIREAGPLAGIKMELPDLASSFKPAVMFPGRRTPPAPKRITAGQPANIKLVPLLLSGTHPLDTGMRLCVGDVRKSFPTATVEVVISFRDPKSRGPSERSAEICGLTGISGFPSLVVFVDDQITFYYQGIVFPEVVSRDLASLFS